MAAGKGAGHTPGVAAHRCIKPISFEIKIIQRNHLYGKVKSLGGSFNPLPKSGLSTSRQSTESEADGVLPATAPPGSEQAVQQTTTNPAPPWGAIDPGPPDDAWTCAAQQTKSRVRPIRDAEATVAGRCSE